MQVDELGDFCEAELDAVLQDNELEALFDLTENSFDHARVHDVIEFFLGHKSSITPARMQAKRTDTVTSLSFSPDGKRLACGSIDKTVAVFDLATGALVWERTTDAMVGAVALGGDHVACGCVSRSVETFEAGGDVFTRARAWNLKRSGDRQSVV